jgi:hypothetical protein
MTPGDSDRPGETPEETTDAAAPPPEELRCATCDTLLAADQTYCLECGAPTEIAPRLRRNGRTAWIVGLGLVLAGIGAGALAYAVSGDDGGPRSAASSGSPSSSVIGSLPTDSTGLDTDFPSVSLPTDPILTETTGDTTTEVDTSAFVSDWPTGRTAFTAIVSSVGDLAEAQGTAERVRSNTGESAGILYSSDHAGLRPGYYVVYSGVFDTRAEAIRQAKKLASSFSGAYARQISG